MHTKARNLGDPVATAASLRKEPVHPPPQVDRSRDLARASTALQQLNAGSASASPGAQQVLALQRLVGNRSTLQLLRNGGHREDKEQSRELALQGVEGTGSALPWLDRIQASFGAHDLRGVKAYVSDGASAA